MEKIIPNNIPATNRKEFGYRGINESHDHNVNQQEISDDILDIFNKINNIEKRIFDNEFYIKEETSHLESEKNKHLEIYKQLLQCVNDLADDSYTRKKIILPHECDEENGNISAVINRCTNNITPKSLTKVSKLSILDSFTDKIYIPDSLNVFVHNITDGIISENDTDIYAPFNNRDDLYWIRKVTTDNTINYVDTEYIISMPEEIMTTPKMNEIVIHPFMSKILNVEYRFGDSSSWQQVKGIEYNPIFTQSDFYSTGPIQLNFDSVNANQIKITLRSYNYIEGETNIRNYAFGLKSVYVYINEYIDGEFSYLSAKTSFDEDDCSIIISNIYAEFSNNFSTSIYQNDVMYELYYKNKNGMYQYITDTFPITIPTNDILIKFKIGEKYNTMNISHFCIDYNVIKDESKVLLSYIDDIVVDFRDNFNIRYTTKNTSQSNTNNNINESVMRNIIRHEISYDDGISWTEIFPTFDGHMFTYEHNAFLEELKFNKCYIKVTDFDGFLGISNRFKITSTTIDESPILYSPPSTIYTKAGIDTYINYKARDDKEIVEHQFSLDGGTTWSTIIPEENNTQNNINNLITFTHRITLNTIGTTVCQIKVLDGINPPVFSNKFNVVVQPIEVDGIDIQSDEITVNINETYNINYVISPTNASNKNVTWNSSNSDIVSVDNLGIITALKEGTSTITVTTADGGFTDQCIVNVKIPVNSITINPKSTVLFIGDTINLNYTIDPVNATNKVIRWDSLNNCVNVDSNGTVTAIHSGASAVTITSLDNNLFDTCLINVHVPVSSIQLNKSNEVINVNEQSQLVCNVLPIDAFDKTVTWESNDTSVATVDEFGLVTGVGFGDCIITCRSNNRDIETYCNYHVNAPVSNVTLNTNYLKKYINENDTLVATVYPSYAINKSVIWSSSNPDVVSVDQNGNIHAIQLGTSTITVTTVDGGFNAECIIDVKSRISNIKVNPTEVKLINANDQSWSKDINVFLEGFINSIDTELETINISSNDNSIVDVIKVIGNDWVSNALESFIFKAYGIQNGNSTITVSTSDNRINKNINVLVGDPIRSYQFINVPIDSDGIQRIQIPGGFSRKLKYTVSPSDCIFTFNDCEGYITTKSSNIGRVEFDGEYNAYISHSNSVKGDSWQSLYEMNNFYNTLNNFEVIWTNNLYELNIQETNLSCREDETIEVIAEAIIDQSQVQGDIAEYNFTDMIKVENADINAAGLIINSILPLDNTRVKLILSPNNTESTSLSNIIKFKGNCSKNYITTSFTLIK